MLAKAGIQCPGVDGSSLQINLKDVSGVLANAKKRTATRVRGFTSG